MKLLADEYCKVAILPTGKFITVMANDSESMIHYYYYTGFSNLSFAFQYHDATEMFRAFKKLTAVDIVGLVTQYMQTFELKCPTHTTRPTYPH